MVRSKDNKRNHPSYLPLPPNWVSPAPPSVGPAAISESSSAPSAAAESSSANSGSSSLDQDARIIEMRLRFERAQEEALSRIVWRDLNHPHQVDPQMEFVGGMGDSWKLVLQNYHLHPVFEFELPRDVALSLGGVDRDSEAVVILVSKHSRAVLNFRMRESNFRGLRFLAEKAEWIAAVVQFKVRLGDEMTFKVVYAANWGFVFEVQIVRQLDP